MKSKKQAICFMVLFAFLLSVSRVYSAQTDTNGVDLKPSDLTWAPEEIYPDNEITFTLSYTNQGTETINPDEGITITYRLTLQTADKIAETIGEPLTGNLENLAANVNAQVINTLTAPPAGQYLVTVELVLEPRSVQV